MRAKALGDTVTMLVAVAVLGASLWAYTRIHVWAHDDPPVWAVTFNHDAQNPSLPYYITHEGRWLNAMLFPLLARMSGGLAVCLDLAFLLVFLLVCARRCGARPAYAFAFAVLGLQAMPFTSQIGGGWPVVVVSSTALLSAAAFAVTRLPSWSFYALFGVLLNGCIFSYYFLLPLLHLPLLGHDSLRANARVLVRRVLCPWVGGFLLGQGVMLVAVYGYTLSEFGVGQVGVQIADWRRPLPDADYGDWGGNAARAADTLLAHLRIYTAYRLDVALAALVGMALALSGPVRALPAKALAGAVAVSMYCALVPVGLHVTLRTGAASAIGFAALCFLPPSPRRAVRVAQAVLLLGFTVLWGTSSINAVLWRVGVTETYRTELMRASPLSPDAYDGVAIVGLADTIRSTARMIEVERGRPRWPWRRPPLGMPGDHEGLRWPAVAAAAGFSEVRRCGVGEVDEKHPVCREARLLAVADEAVQWPGDRWPWCDVDASRRGRRCLGAGGLYRVLGTIGGGEAGWLVVRLEGCPTPCR